MVGSSARLDSTLVHMRERLQGKMGNRNDNAFKLRRLFKMYDKEQSGMVSALHWLSHSDVFVHAYTEIIVWPSYLARL